MYRKKNKVDEFTAKIKSMRMTKEGKQATLLLATAIIIIIGIYVFGYIIQSEVLTTIYFLPYLLLQDYLPEVMAINILAVMLSGGIWICILCIIMYVFTQL